VPERVFIAGGGGGNGHGGEGLPAGLGGASAGTGLLGMLLSLLVAEKSGFDVASLPGGNSLQDFADKISQQAMENIKEAMAPGSGAGTNVDLTLEVTDPSKTIAAASKPQAATTVAAAPKTTVASAPAGSSKG
jgi:hypothetical protein